MTSTGTTPRGLTLNRSTLRRTKIRCQVSRDVSAKDYHGPDGNGVCVFETLGSRGVANSMNSIPQVFRRRMLEQRFPSPSGEVRLDPDTQHCYKTPRIGQIQSDGQIEIVWAAAEAVPPDPFPSSRTATEWLALLSDLYQGWGNQWSAQ